MNNNFMLQNLIENGNAGSAGEQRAKKASKAGGHELELLVGTIFNEVCQLFEDNNIKMPVPEEVTRITDKAALLKSFIEQLVSAHGGDAQRLNDSAAITCKDCQQYESNLQKLEGQVRQHIRLEQQLKIFQDNQDEKLDEFKKERKDLEKKVENAKKQLEELRNNNNALSEKVGRLEGELDALRKENRELKRNAAAHTHEGMTTKRESHKPATAYAYEAKENKIDWVHRNISVKKDEKDKQLEKEKQYERKSIEKRGESAEKGWRQSNTKSNKMISVLNDKLIHEKTKEERKKAIQSKLEFRR